MDQIILEKAKEELERQRDAISQALMGINRLLSMGGGEMAGDHMAAMRPMGPPGGGVGPTEPAGKVKRKYKPRRPKAQPAKGKAESGEPSALRKLKTAGSWPPEGLGRRGNKLIDAMREVIGEYKGTFDRETVKTDLARKGWDKDKLNACAINLIDMTKRGELKRTGFGSTALYKVHKLKETAASGTVEPSAKEKAFAELRKEIQVPRDADAPEDNG